MYVAPNTHEVLDHLNYQKQIHIKIYMDANPQDQLNKLFGFMVNYPIDINIFLFFYKIKCVVVTKEHSW